MKTKKDNRTWKPIENLGNPSKNNGLIGAVKG